MTRARREETHGIPPATLTEVCTTTIYRIRRHVQSPDLRHFQQNREIQDRGALPPVSLARLAAPPLMSYQPGRRILVYNRQNQQAIYDQPFDAPRMPRR